MLSKSSLFDFCSFDILFSSCFTSSNKAMLSIGILMPNSCSRSYCLATKATGGTSNLCIFTPLISSKDCAARLYKCCHGMWKLKPNKAFSLLAIDFKKDASITSILGI